MLVHLSIGQYWRTVPCMAESFSVNSRITDGDSAGEADATSGGVFLASAVWADTTVRGDSKKIRR